MVRRQYSTQYVMALFILVALAVETLPLWLVSLNRIESYPQFQRTVTTLALSTAVTVGLGTWLFMRTTRRMHLKLEQSEKSYRELFASIKSPVVAFTDKLVITFCNAAWAELVGGHMAELVGRKVSDALPGWENTTLRTVSQRVLQSGAQEQYSVHYGGREFDVWVWRTPEGLLLFSDDITERERLLLATKRLAAMVESNDDAIILVDLLGKVTDWNRGAERIYGYSADEMDGQPIQRILGPGRDEEFRRIMERVLGGQSVRQIETERLTKDRRTISVALTVSPVMDGKGNVLSIASVTRDITRRRELEAELVTIRQKEAELLAIQRTAATAAHEINNPLAAQLLLLTSLREEFGPNQVADAAEMLEQAIEQARRIAKTVEALQQVAEPAYKTYIGKTKMLDLGSSPYPGAGSAIT